ncbi:MTH1187 family thiamine-binding protein [Calditrichota bacterium]
MVLLEFSMSPFGKGESLSPYVSRVLKIIDESKVSYRLTPMGTILEGEWDKVMAVVTSCFRELEKDCTRISTHIRIDYRQGNNPRMQQKINSIETKLNRKMST